MPYEIIKPKKMQGYNKNKKQPNSPEKGKEK